LAQQIHFSQDLRLFPHRLAYENSLTNQTTPQQGDGETHRGKARCRDSRDGHWERLLPETLSN
jgi:hypothetical protein